MSDKLRFWASVTLFAAIGAITLLNLSNQHERAASPEVVIDMPDRDLPCAPWLKCCPCSPLASWLTVD